MKERFQILVAASVANIYRESHFSEQPIYGTWDDYTGLAVVCDLTLERLDGYEYLRITLQPIVDVRANGKESHSR